MRPSLPAAIVLGMAMCFFLSALNHNPRADADAHGPEDVARWDAYLAAERNKYRVEQRAFFSTWDAEGMVAMQVQSLKAKHSAEEAMRNAACDAAFRHYQRAYVREDVAQSTLISLLVSKGWVYDTDRKAWRPK